MSFYVEFSTKFMQAIFSQDNGKDNFPAYLYPGLNLEQLSIIARQKSREKRQRGRLQEILQNGERFEVLYNRLENDASRACMIDQLVFAMLGPLYCKPLKLDKKYREFEEMMFANRIPGITIKKTELFYHKNPLFLYELERQKIQVFSQLYFLYEMIYFRQYFYTHKQVKIGAMPGDYVLDCGAGIGDNSLLFSHAVGRTGHVYALECSETTAKYCNINIKQNIEHSQRISIHQYAVAEESGKELTFFFEGGSTTMQAAKGEEAGEKVQTITIDDFVEKYRVKKIDFIKMDLEGAERLALQGATATIQRWKPKLAISIYHLKDDYLVLSELITQILPSYKFYMAHHSPHFSETVLYCKAD